MDESPMNDEFTQEIDTNEGGSETKDSALETEENN
jgi:hypothetical protein